MDEGDGSARVRRQVTVLAEKFLQRTQGEVVVLRELIERVDRGDSTVLGQMEQMAHKIHGSGAMFGFPAVSEYAGEIERLTERLTTADAATGEARDQTLRCLMESTARILQAVEAAAGLLRPFPPN